MIYPNSKRYNRKTFTSENFYVICARFSRGRNGFADECTIFYNGSEYVEGVQKWINRTWESFDYESAMLQAMKKLPNNLQDIFRKEIITAQKEREERQAEAFLSSFKKNYESLSDKSKEILKKTPMIETAEQASAVAGVVGALDVLDNI